MVLAGPWTRGAADLAAWPPGTVSPADEARFRRYAEALAFWQGDQWTDRARRGESRLVLNYARTLVRKVASYVFPAPVSFNVPAEPDEPALPAGPSGCWPR